MTWEARIKAALHGEVKGGDIAALLAATNPLASLRQQLDDRRLTAQLDHADKAWLAAFELGELAAPLWLAEALVGAASSFVEAEAEGHPNRPDDMGSAVHDQCLALLYPVGPMIAELSAMFADPSRRFPFTLPATFGPHGSLTLISIPLPLPAPYVRGLLRAAERTQGAALAALEDLRAQAAGSSPPAWLTAALQQAAGESAAASSRLEMAQVNAAPLLHGGAVVNDIATRLTGDVWSVVDTYLRLGQQASNPLLLPGAPVRPAAAALPPQPAAYQAPPYQALPPPSAPPAYQAPPPAPPAYQAPPQPPAPTPTPRVVAPPPEPNRALPQIAPSWRPTPATPTVPATPIATPQPAASSPLPTHAGEVRALPQINAGAWPARAQQAASLPRIDSLEHATAPTPAARPASTPNPDPNPNLAPTPLLTSSAAAPRHIERDARWMLSTTALRHRLRTLGHEDEAERALAAFWDARHWSVSLGEQAYLDEVAGLLSRGAIVVDERDPGSAPFAPVYRVVAPEVVVRGQRAAAGRFVSYDYAHGQVRVF